MYKQAVVQIRVREAEKAAWKKEAKKVEMSVSEWLRMVANARVSAVGPVEEEEEKW